MAKKKFRSPFDIHKEIAATETARAKPSPDLSGREIPVVVGGFREAAIPALFDPETRTTFPIRNDK